MLNRVRHSVALAVVCLALCACSTSPKEVPVQPPSAPEADNVSEQLSRGRTTSIETSQGHLTLQPTVVDMQAQGSADAPDSEQKSVEFHDPLQWWNRGVFQFNHLTYTYGLIPIVKGYEFITPTPVRDGIGNAFLNIREPLNLLNNLAAGEVKDASINLGRFLVNSTVGLLGLFDPATAWFNLPAARQSLDATLARYNVGIGPYLVLPFFGQNSLRGSVSLVSDTLLDPLRHITSPPDTYYLQAVDVVDSYSDRVLLYEKLYQEAEDPYLYFRNQFLQGVKRDDAFAPTDQ